MRSPESVYKSEGYTSKLYIDPLFEAEKIPNDNVRAGFTVTDNDAGDTVIFSSIDSLIDDSYPEIVGGNPSLDHGICEFSSCSFSEEVQPVFHIEYLTESSTSGISTTRRPICTDCYVDVRDIVEEHLCDQSELLSNYISMRL